MTLSLLGAVVIGGALFGYQKISSLAEQKINKTENQLFIIEKGTTGKKLAESLQEQGIIADGSLLPYLFKLKPELAKFKAGVYSLENVNSVQELLEHLSSGKEVQLIVQFIEGRTFKAWREILENASYLEQTLKGKSEAEVAKLLDIPHAKLEGWIAPNTYSYVPHSTDLELLKRAYSAQKKTLDAAWQNRAENLPLKNPYEMLILASIVEKETAIASERPQVASVFVNRLREGWKLQTDPTVIYGMGDSYDGNIRKKDLETPTPYNTYVIQGLPPTPIAMPSAEAINAVSQPDSTPYFYFVADGSGGHKFSRTLDEHNKAVRDWIKIERERKTQK